MKASNQRNEVNGFGLKNLDRVISAEEVQVFGIQLAEILSPGISIMVVFFYEGFLADSLPISLFLFSISPENWLLLVFKMDVSNPLVKRRI